MELQTMRLAFEGAVARLTLARPGVANRVGVQTLRELGEAVEAIAATEGVSLTILDAEGADFCAGWDGDIQGPGDVPLDPFGGLAELPVPVLAVLQGRVASAGLELGLACDMRIARDDARFACGDVVANGLPLAGATARLPRIAGRSVASAMLLLGDELDATAAYRCGLVSRVIAGADFESEVAAIAGRVTGNGPLGLRYAKEAVVNGIELPLDQALRYELDLSIILQTTRDRAEGVQAFLEKRAPRFEGR